MKTLFYEIELLFSEGGLFVLLSNDFKDNCLSFDPHMHTHTKYELHYIESGSFSLELKEGSLLCPEGHILIIPPNTQHKICPQENTRTKTLLYVINSKDEGGAVLPALQINAPALIKDSLHLNEQLLRVCALSSQKEALAKEYVRGEMTLFFASLASLLSPTVAEQSDTGSENRAENISAYIHDGCFSRDCSIEGLARLLHLSTRQVHRLCLAYYGLPFRALLHRTRMEIAKYRLENTAVSATALAEALGYASPSSFSAAYKRHFGTSPKQKT